MRAATGHELASIIAAPEIEARIIRALDVADRRGSHLNTRLIAARVLPDHPAAEAIVATRAALRRLERQGVVRRLVHGEGQGQSIWCLVPAYVSEGVNGRRSLFFSRSVTPR